MQAGREEFGGEGGSPNMGGLGMSKVKARKTECAAVFFGNSGIEFRRSYFPPYGNLTPFTSYKKSFVKTIAGVLYTKFIFSGDCPAARAKT